MSISSQSAEAAKELKPLLKKVSFNKVVNAMSNRQRNQWARAGYPGLSKKDPIGPSEFIYPTQLLAYLRKFDARN